MTRPKPRYRPLPPGEKSFHIWQGEVLHIGKHPAGYSNSDHVVVTITNEEAIRCIGLGWRVYVAPKNASFLGEIQEEHLLYIVIDVPKQFEMDIVSSWRLQSYLKDTNQAIVEFTTKHWTFENIRGDGPDKHGVNLTLTEIYMVDEEEESVVVSELPVHEAKMTQREWDNRDNYLRTHWNVGEEFYLDGIHYLIGDIRETGDRLTIRLDKKYQRSRIIHVPR